MAEPELPSSQNSDSIPSSQGSDLSDAASQIIPNNDDAPHQRDAIRKEDRVQRRRQRRDEYEDGEWSPSQETEGRSSSPEASEDEGTLRPASDRSDESDEASSSEESDSEDDVQENQTSSDPPDRGEPMPEAVTEDWLRDLYYMRTDMGRQSPLDVFDAFKRFGNRPKLARLDDVDVQIAWNIIMDVYKDRRDSSYDDEEEAPGDLRNHARDHWAAYSLEHR
ncbi:hypothetical protein PsYK624_037300 [Phanerochaete sordida]|uniref:Uncharacterized protein n=1 Tax=Phanerochaete sordida TaxID=48140 RepID=A0A9P3G3Y7_9APHY|nr:hypothetical protein PsYK624_037300 [Phanerochaete sordida]